MFIFHFDFQFYYIPKLEINKFYIYSGIYSTLGILSALIIREALRNDQQSNINSSFRLVLGILWIVDGILQFQPEMPYGFLLVVIFPSIQAIPFMNVEQFLMIGYNTWLLHPFQFDALSGALQVFIGSAFLLNNSQKGLRIISIISIGWDIIIWIFGEGFGGIPEVGVSLLTGFPGSALIYLFLALPYVSKRFSDRSYLKNYMKYTLATILIIGAILQLIPGNTFWNSGQLSFDIYMNISQQGENPYVYFLLNHAYPLFLFRESYLNIFMALLLITAAIFTFFNIRTGILISLLFIGLIWVLFQDMGIYILPATDPNTGLPLLMFGLIFISISGKIRKIG
ncbi:MAG: hypothetical protein ACYCR9_07050, partial [Cuniculiplasma sp.]